MLPTTEDFIMTKNLVLGGKFGINWQDSTSASGYNLAEVRSAFIKKLRQGNEWEALYWAIELLDTDPAVVKPVWDDLEVFALEDVGLANTEALVQVQATRLLYERLPTNDSRRYISIASVTCYLARTKKTRYQNEILADVQHERATGAVHLDIPDEALDMHVRRGRERGRGLLHYLTAASRLANKMPFPRQYRNKQLARAKKA